MFRFPFVLITLILREGAMNRQFLTFFKFRMIVKSDDAEKICC
jgi:hypothetical protein